MLYEKMTEHPELHNLICEYVRLIIDMERSRECPQVYVSLDKKRSGLHTKIMGYLCSSSDWRECSLSGRCKRDSNKKCWGFLLVSLVETLTQR